MAPRKRDLGAAQRLLRKYDGRARLSELIQLLEAPPKRGGRPVRWQAWLQRIIYLLVEELKARHGIGTRQAWRRAVHLTGDTLASVERYYARGRALMREPDAPDDYDRALVAAIAECLAEFSPRKVPQKPPRK